MAFGGASMNVSCGNQLGEGWQDILECPICLSVLTKPQSLSCGHCLCECCINGIVVRNRTRRTVTCPTCRRCTSVPDSGLPTNFLVLNIIDHIKEEQENFIAKNAQFESICLKLNELIDAFLNGLSELHMPKVDQGTGGDRNFNQKPRNSMRGGKRSNRSRNKGQRAARNSQETREYYTEEDEGPSYRGSNMGDYNYEDEEPSYWGSSRGNYNYEDEGPSYRGSNRGDYNYEDEGPSYRGSNRGDYNYEDEGPSYRGSNRGDYNYEDEGPSYRGSNRGDYNYCRGSSPSLKRARNMPGRQGQYNTRVMRDDEKPWKRSYRE